MAAAAGRESRGGRQKRAAGRGWARDEGRSRDAAASSGGGDGGGAAPEARQGPAEAPGRRQASQPRGKTESRALTSFPYGSERRKEASRRPGDAFNSKRISASSVGTRLPSPVPASSLPPPRRLGNVRPLPPPRRQPFGEFRNSSAGDPRACSRRLSATVPRVFRVFSELERWISE